MDYLSAEDQRQRIIEVAQAKGVDCPEMVVEELTTVLGGGLVNYRCKEGDRVEDLELTPEEAEYVGLDMNAYGPPETGGY